MMMMMKYYDLEKNNKKKKYTKYKLINNLINSTDGLIIIGTTSASITISITRVVIIVVPVTAGVGCATGILVKFVPVLKKRSKIINLSTLLLRRHLMTLDNYLRLA